MRVYMEGIRRLLHLPAPPSFLLWASPRRLARARRTPTTDRSSVSQRQWVATVNGL
jgi:hypothetical protein